MRGGSGVLEAPPAAGSVFGPGRAGQGPGLGFSSDVADLSACRGDVGGLSFTFSFHSAVISGRNATNGQTSRPGFPADLAPPLPAQVELGGGLGQGGSRSEAPRRAVPGPAPSWGPWSWWQVILPPEPHAGV